MTARHPRAPAPTSTASARAVRRLVAAGVPPDEVTWTTTACRACSPPSAATTAPADRRCRARLAELIRLVVCHRDPERYAPALHRWSGASCTASATCSRSRPTRWSTASTAWRSRSAATCTRCTPSSASAASRPRPGERFVAWFEPDHHILDATADFFVDRFRSLDWTILTPDGSPALGPRDASHRGPPGHARRRARPPTPSRPAGAATTRAPSTRRAST